MARIRLLTPAEARKTLVHKLAPTVDRLRQLSTNFGLASYRVFLTWTKWTGEERGEGNEGVFKRIEILPTPRVTNLDSVSFSPYHGGLLPIGSIRVDQISSIAFTYDTLTGLIVPQEHEDAIPQPF